MKKVILFFGVGLLFSNYALAGDSCFLVKEKDKIIKQEGDCKTRYSPCSSFKIAISLMGYDSGFLIDETHPELPFKEGYADWLEAWKKPQNPITWMKLSCVWYSQIITQKLGMDKFQDYVNKLDYGNKDLAGDKGENNGLTNAWLSSSLEISPEEQTVFLQKLIEDKLSVSPKAQEMTKKIQVTDDLPNGWKMHGKTGSGNLLSADRIKKTEIKHGWFVGWIEKDGRKIVFANHIVDDSKQDNYAGPRAKEIAKEKLTELIKNL